MIAIVDYGLGNLRSIYNALVRVNAVPEIVCEPEGLAEADGVVVPGVGAFGRCMEKLSKFEDPLSDVRKAGTPMLGICIGLQVLFEKSQESPEARGFGWISGQVVRLPEEFNIPHMGWNNLSIKKHVDLLDGVVDGDMFYFVHSYYCLPEDKSVIAATTDYGTDVTAMISKDNLTATQFHPEKSGQKGLRILENFVRSTRC
jgi:imidazole glycerol-phosphate synthase subunit HisH